MIEDEQLDDLESAAAHDGGHSLMTILCGGAVTQARAKKSGSGKTEVADLASLPADARLRIAYAGVCGESVLLGAAPSKLPPNDRAIADSALKELKLSNVDEMRVSLAVAEELAAREVELRATADLIRTNSGRFVPGEQLDALVQSD